MVQQQLVREAMEEQPEQQQDILRELYYYILRNQSISAENLTIGHVVDSLKLEGLWFWRDERFEESQNFALARAGHVRAAYTHKVHPQHLSQATQVSIDFADFCQLIAPCARLFLKAFSEEMVIPDWATLTTDMTYHFHEVESNHLGSNANYIPILRDANSDKWALSICSTDGQRFSVGDTDSTFTLQSVSKPVTYAMGLQKEGHDFMDEWIDMEPAGRPFNTQDLEPTTNRPFNSSVNSGAIMAAAIVGSGYDAEYTWREVVDQVRAQWYELCGNDLDIGFSNETFQSEKSCAWNNFAISYNIQGRRGFPRGIDLHKVLDIYLGCCSLEMTTEALSVAAATLANGGVCPITGKEVFPAHVTRTVLSELMMCGMYDQAGRFAVEVGLPSKSGVSGVLMVIVPNLLGFATFSPRLNAKGNSVRGIEFFKKVVGSYRVHLFEPLRSGNTGAKVDPRKNGYKNERAATGHMAWAVAVGDKYAIRLRDIFLFALCRTAVNANGGLSERSIDMIRKKYAQVYQAQIDEDVLSNIVHAVRKNPSDLKFLEALTKDVYVKDSWRSLVLLSMLDILTMDGFVEQHERSVAVRIAVLLGIDKDIALMELNRYLKNSPAHRSRSAECYEMIDTISVGPQRLASDRDIMKQNSPIKSITGDFEGSAEEENALLREEIALLRQKVETLSKAAESS